MVIGVVEKILDMCITQKILFKGNKKKTMCDLHLSSFYWPLDKTFCASLVYATLQLYASVKTEYNN